MINMENKKILLISNEALTKSNSNGRTVMNMLAHIPKECLAQMYIHGVPDENFCKMFYCNSDDNALKTFLLRKKKEKNKSQKVVEQNTYRKYKPKWSCRNLFLRNIVWQSMRWWQADFDEFLDTFNPDVVLLQAGDAPFMYAIARKISKKYNTKLVMFNTEAYVLKKKLYSSIDNDCFWHTILMNSLKKQYVKFMYEVDFCIYNTEILEEAYQTFFPHKGKSSTIYISSDVEKLEDNSSGKFTLLYCGNLGVGRDEQLDKLAKALYDVDTSAKIDVYGKFVSEESKEMLCSNLNIQYQGFVDYSKIPDLMSRASMLIHCENDKGLENLKYAFSTKIADCLASSRPFLVFASNGYPFVQYLKKNNCAHIASNSDELKKILSRSIEDSIYRKKYINNANLIVSKNHNLKNNCEKFIRIISQITYEHKGG